MNAKNKQARWEKVERGGNIVTIYKNIVKGIQRTENKGYTCL